MKEGHAGQKHKNHMLGSDASGEHKRHVSDLELAQLKKLTKSQTSPVYHDKTLKELYENKTVWVVFYEALSPQVNHNKIAYVVIFIKETVWDVWVQREKMSETWERFLELLHFQVTDSINYMTYTCLKLKKSKQYKDKLCMNSLHIRMSSKMIY